MDKNALLGDEAIALGAIHAGLSAAYGYPGTPSTEIMEFLINYTQSLPPGSAPIASWTTNEKTACEAALGVSFAGRRALVTMKHVGLNVAMDPFVNAALLEIKGGLVLAVADDPGMHSSQNEQDTRQLADFAGVPCFEPVNQQEAYDMTRAAFDLSERFHVPVIIRVTTRIAHSRAGITTTAVQAPNPLAKAGDPTGWMLLPNYARKRYDKLCAKLMDIEAWSASCLWNTSNLSAPTGEKAEFGILTSGLGRNYYQENLPELISRLGLKHPPLHVHVGFYPAPVAKIRELAQSVKRLICLEEGFPFLESRLRGFSALADGTSSAFGGCRISGRLDGSLPRSGELNPDLVRKALGLPDRPVLAAGPGSLPGRPPQLCNGCPHGDTYNAIAAALKGLESTAVTADIGCYALGALPPFSVPETIVCMGASVSMAKGASDAGIKHVVGVIGDSTFLHSGITPLIDAIASNTPMTLVILDNSIVAMTGCQPTMLPSGSLKSIILGLGLHPDHLHVVEAHRKNQDSNTVLLRQEIEYRGVSVVIAVRECLEAIRIRKKQTDFAKTIALPEGCEESPK